MKIKNFGDSYYFYYESKLILIETIMASLNGLHIANTHLFRTFIEFTLLQNYFHNKMVEKNNFDLLKNYFNKGNLPKWPKMIKGAIPNNNFCNPIKKRIQLELKALSISSNHAYIPFYSPRAKGIFKSGHSIYSLHFWINLSFILETCLWVYYVNYPMLLKPVNLLKKYGFEFPLGRYIDSSLNEVIRKSLKKEDYVLFAEYAEKIPTVKSLMKIYESREDLSNEEILNTFDEEEYGEIKNIQNGYAKVMAERRAFKELMSFRYIIDNRDYKFDESILTKMNFASWRTFYKKIP